jgi:hypothetical protein
VFEEYEGALRKFEVGYNWERGIYTAELVMKGIATPGAPF